MKISDFRNEDSEKIEMTIVMDLKEGTDFELSFSFKDNEENEQN